MRFESLTVSTMDAATMYAVCRLRQDVFVVEQECLYPDLDGRDMEPEALHLVMRDDDGEVIGYARLIDDGDVLRIGRVVLDSGVRGRGLADPLLRHAVAAAGDRDPGRDVVLGAQSPLAGWYAGFGFSSDGPEYVEDGIPHTPMRLHRNLIERAAPGDPG